MPAFLRSLTVEYEGRVYRLWFQRARGAVGAAELLPTSTGHCIHCIESSTEMVEIPIKPVLSENDRLVRDLVALFSAQVALHTLALKNSAIPRNQEFDNHYDNPDSGVSERERNAYLQMLKEMD